MCHPATCLLLASLIAQVDPPTPTADPGSAERVLGEAGLKPLANSYVLDGEIEALKIVDWTRQAEEQMARLSDRIRPLEQEYAAARRRADDLTGRASALRQQARSVRYTPDNRDAYTRQREADRLDEEADRLEREAEDYRRRMRNAEAEAGPLVRERDAVGREVQRQQLTYRRLVAETLKRYAALAADPRIKAALRELNRGRQPKVALGPVDAYQANVVKASLEILAALGLREERGAFILADEASFVERVGAADLIQREIGMHERRLQELPPSSGSPGASAATGPARKTADLLAERRAQFSQRVPELRQLADSIMVQHRTLAQDVEVQDALAEIGKVRRTKARIATKPGSQVSLQKLADMEKVIRESKSP